MTSEDSVNRSFEEIAENYIIPPEIEPVLKNALTVQFDVENSFTEPEKEVLPYLRIKSSIDSHIGGILQLCRKK